MAFRHAGVRSPMGPFLLSSLVVLAAVIALGTCGSGTPPAPGEADQTALVDADLTQLVVDFKDGTTKALFDALEVGWGIDLEFNSVEGVRSGITLARVEPSRLEALLRLVRADPNVEAAEPLFSYWASFTPNDPQFGRQWNLEMARMREAWDLTRGAGVIVAVIDTGIAYEDHGEFRLVPDLKGAKFAPGYDFVNDDEHANDDHGHGTHVAGTIAQRTHNGEGVAGVAFEATLMPLKVLDANGTGSSADIADAIRWAADHGAKVLNLSLGGGGRSEVLEAAVDYARKKGAVVVCAAGNGGRGVVEYPAAYPGAVAVSAVAPDGKLASYSSWGKEVDLAAPGGDIRRSGKQEDGILQNTIVREEPARSVYAYFQGTSMATPHVAGVAALLFGAGASGPDEVEKALFEGADRSKTGAWNDKYGHGILDAKGALEALGAPGAKRPFWKKLLTLLWALLLWAIARVTLPRSARRALRPGAGFFGALALTTLGLFFLPWLGVHSGFDSPLPHWGNALFGGAKANPIFYSAIIPILLCMVGFRRAGLRGLLAGLTVGFAAVLLAGALAGTSVAWMPLGALSRPWLVVNGLVSLLLARALMSQAGAR